MYGHQSIPRSVSTGQMNAMMSHPGMVITSQQMINTPQGVMVSQAGYPQGMINTAQPQPQMIPSQAHMGQQMMNTHMGIVQSLNQPGHMNVQQHQQMQPMQQVQMASQQAYIQQQGISHANFVNGQARSPAVGACPQGISQQGTPGRPSSTSGPPSNNPQTPLNAISNLNPSSQQVSTPATPQQAPSSVQSTTTQDNISTPTVVPPDPVSLARNLLLRDLRYSLQDWSKTAAEVIRPSTLRQQDGSGAAMHNPMSVNPQSVNPQSVNPQSVNPLSANPSSVKSLDEPKSMVVQEAQKQSVKFDKMFAGELKIVGEMANVNYSQYAQGYVESTSRVRNAITCTLKNLNATMERMNAAKIVGSKDIEEKMAM
ncbi:Iator family member (Mdt-29) [Dirofilaria immitis]|nr:Iator family member (Mdt-29) [Dirofilaria immitis]